MVLQMNLRALKDFALYALATCLLITAAHAQQSKTRVMVLGVYHFANPNADVVKSDFPDHLSDKKQQEIAEVLARLAKFNPTKIVVERTPEDTGVQDNYRSYLAGTYKLAANETEQIGFRLAKQLGHKQVYLCDHRVGMDIDAVIKAANESGNKYFLDQFQKTIGEVTAMQKREAQMTVLDALIELNEPALQTRTREFYLQLARVRSKDGFVGADVLATWYQRNFRILTNIFGTIDSTQDRILVIFGQGHAPYLRDGISSSQDLQLIEPNDYLKKKL